MFILLVLPILPLLHENIGALTLVSVSWYAAEVVREFWRDQVIDAAFQYEFGAALYVGWICSVGFRYLLLIFLFFLFALLFRIGIAVRIADVGIGFLVRSRSRAGV